MLLFLELVLIEYSKPRAVHGLPLTREPLLVGKTVWYPVIVITVVVIFPKEEGGLFSTLSWLRMLKNQKTETC